jgi:hypothetical protein
MGTKVSGLNIASVFRVELEDSMFASNFGIYFTIPNGVINRSQDLPP